MSEPEEPIRMEIKGLMLDQAQNLPIVILRDEANSVLLPIWIGVFEANAIALRIEGVATPRPMTHDLLSTCLADLGVTLDRVLISDLRDNTFYAEIHLDSGKKTYTVDSRPSDAIALALRSQAPIFVLPSVLAKAKAVDLGSKLDEDERLKKWLEEMDPEDLGKYKM